eukprot:6274681-Ditylum_brightwellii.AAC.1
MALLAYPLMSEILSLLVIDDNVAVNKFFPPTSEEISPQSSKKDIAFAVIALYSKKARLFYSCG